MSLGSVPIKFIEQMFHIIDFNKWDKIYVCCSGTFRFERCLFQTLENPKIFSNDVSLFSSSIAHLALGEKLNVKFKNKLNFINKYEYSEPIDIATAIMLAFRMGVYDCNNDFSLEHMKYFIENWDNHFGKIKKSLYEYIAKISIQKYNCTDWLEHIEEAKSQGAGVIAFPPFFKGDYEIMFNFLNKNIDWNSPDYSIYDPKNLVNVLDDLQKSDINFCLLSDQRFSDYEPVLKFSSGRGLPHYCYTYSSKSSVRRFNTKSEPFRYEKFDFNKLTKNAKVSIHCCDNKNINFIKDVYLKKSITHCNGVFSFLVYIDNMLAGGLIYDFCRYGKNHLYLLSDFSISRKNKLSKFISLISTSKTIISDIDLKSLRRFTHIRTTAMTPHSVSMKYRGVFKKTSSKKAEDGSNIINYVSTVRNETPQEMYDNFYWKKYGKQ